MQQSHNVLFRLQDPFGNKVHKGLIIFTGPLQQADILMPQDRWNYDRHIAVLNKRCVHQQSGDPFVSVCEREDKHKSLMQLK